MTMHTDTATLLDMIRHGVYMAEIAYEPDTWPDMPWRITLL